VRACIGRRISCCHGVAATNCYYVPSGLLEPTLSQLSLSSEASMRPSPVTAVLGSSACVCVCVQGSGCLSRSPLQAGKQEKQPVGGKWEQLLLPAVCDRAGAIVGQRRKREIPRAQGEETPVPRVITLSLLGGPFRRTPSPHIQPHHTIQPHSQTLNAARHPVYVSLAVQSILPQPSLCCPPVPTPAAVKFLSFTTALTHRSAARNPSGSFLVPSTCHFVRLLFIRGLCAPACHLSTICMA